MRTFVASKLWVHFGPCILAIVVLILCGGGVPPVIWTEVGQALRPETRNSWVLIQASFFLLAWISALAAASIESFQWVRSLMSTQSREVKEEKRESEPPAKQSQVIIPVKNRSKTLAAPAKEKKTIKLAAPAPLTAYAFVDLFDDERDRMPAIREESSGVAEDEFWLVAGPTSSNPSKPSRPEITTPSTPSKPLQEAKAEKEEGATFTMGNPFEGPLPDIFHYDLDLKESLKQEQVKE